MRCLFIIRWDPKEKRSSCSNKANKGNAQTGNRKHRFDSRILVKGKEIRMGLRNKQTKQIFSFKTLRSRMGVGKQVRVIVGKTRESEFSMQQSHLNNGGQPSSDDSQLHPA